MLQDYFLALIYKLNGEPPSFLLCDVRSHTISYCDGINQRHNPLKPRGHHMYLTVVTVCTAQWSLYVPHSGHYMYRTVVTVCTAQWSLYVPHSGHCMYRTAVTIYTATLTFNNPTFCPHSVFLCFVRITQQTAIICLHNVNWNWSLKLLLKTISRTFKGLVVETRSKTDGQADRHRFHIRRGFPLGK